MVAGVAGKRAGIMSAFEKLWNNILTCTLFVSVVFVGIRIDVSVESVLIN